jgi:hypothetical protein
MVTTTLSLNEDLKERLEQYRHGSHDSWNDTISGILDVLPDEEDVHETGCVYCGEVHHGGGAIEDRTFFLSRFVAEDPVEEGTTTFRASNYFCSLECARKQREETDHLLPRNPDRVHVGGDEQPRAILGGGELYVTTSVKELMFDIPGALDGTSDHGHEYDYVGEPVYLKNNQEWVKSFTIEDLTHEDSKTVLTLTRDTATEKLNHPDDAVRDAYVGKHAKWFTAECPDCGERLRSHEGAGEQACPECGLVMEDVEDHRVEADQ